MKRNPCRQAVRLGLPRDGKPRSAFRLIDGVWQRVGRHHTTCGFASMLEATEYAETLNAKTWERFDWLLEPQEAYLAIRD
jgi:hypothetical protein